MTLDAVIRRIRRESERLGSQRAFAAECGVAHSYVRRVLCGDRPPSDAILQRLNLQRVVSYKARTSDEGTGSAQPAHQPPANGSAP